MVDLSRDGGVHGPRAMGTMEVAMCTTGRGAMVVAMGTRVRVEGTMAMGAVGEGHHPDHSAHHLMIDGGHQRVRVMGRQPSG